MKAEIYSKPNCKFCVAAKELLERRGIEYVELQAPDHLETLMERIDAAGQPRPRTVPQIFLDGAYIGGYDRLAEQLGA